MGTLVIILLVLLLVGAFLMDLSAAGLLPQRRVRLVPDVLVLALTDTLNHNRGT